MPVIMSLEDWKRGTSLALQIRSSELREIDSALEAFERQPTGVSLSRLKLAVNAWKLKQGGGDAWKKSSRNDGRTVERLVTALEQGKFRTQPDGRVQLLDAADTEANFSGAPAFMQSKLNDSRRGVLYVLGHIDIDTEVFSVVLDSAQAITGAALGLQKEISGVKDFELAQTCVSEHGVSFSSVLAFGSQVRDDFGKNTAARQGFHRVKDQIWSFVQSVWKSLKDNFINVELGCGVLRLIANAGLEMLKPVLGGVAEVLPGFIQTAKASLIRFKTWSNYRKVKLNSGHPEAVVSSLLSAMTQDILSGVWSMMKGALNVGLAAVTAAASSIASIVVAVFELIVKIIYRLMERRYIKKVLSEASAFWAGSSAESGLHMEPFKFTNWFRNSVLRHPALAVVVLNSGYCGDKMAWLAMVKAQASESQITPAQQAEFNLGVEYLDKLKEYGAGWLKDSGFKFKTDVAVLASGNMCHGVVALR